MIGDNKQEYNHVLVVALLLRTYHSEAVYHLYTRVDRLAKTTSHRLLGSFKERAELDLTSTG